jgi:hypothetical protein
MKNQYKILAEQYNLIVNAAQEEAESQIDVPEEIDREQLPTDLKAFLDWIYTHTIWKRQADVFQQIIQNEGYKDMLHGFFWARYEDYREGVGLEWNDAVKAAVELVLKLAQEYKIWLAAKETLYKDTPGVNIDI